MPETSLKAGRFDGTPALGWLRDTLLAVPVGAAYVPAREELPTQFDQPGMFREMVPLITPMRWITLSRIHAVEG